KLTARQTQRNALAPAHARRGLGGEQSQAVSDLDTNASARGHRGDRVVSARQDDGFILVARELGDRSKRPYAPVGLVIGHLAGKKFEIAREIAHGGPPADVSDGFHGNTKATPSRSPRTTSTP